MSWGFCFRLLLLGTLRLRLRVRLGILNSRHYVWVRERVEDWFWVRELRRSRMFVQKMPAFSSSLRGLRT